ncbi:MAG: histidinol dehydrogenase [Oscillospiraceae bacterium]|jgi:histidinol dehydrogenase|nr:histidinol dehydrogenase [Oscillospiraceae bacterium]
MVPIILCDGVKEKALFAALKERSGAVDANITAAVSEILATVRERGDLAVQAFTEHFDMQQRRDTLNVIAAVRAMPQGAALPPSREIPRAALELAAAQCDAEILKAMQAASENIRRFHARQLRQSMIVHEADGVVLGQRIRPLKRVGVYVPGGTALYPSSVLMNVLPAKIAGVEEIIMATPAQPGGGADQNILAAAQIAGVDRVFLVGGAQGIAALAYGTETIPQVDKLVGPGNIFVATAKKLLYGTVDIDMIAGPSEILIVADGTASPRYLAADLLSQAEHDKLASAVLLCTSEAVAAATARELESQLPLLPRREIAAEALQNYGAILVCESMEQAIGYANAFAPEHLELCTADAMELLGAVENAGSVFLGHYTPESVGDYYAGPNHVLPTGGTPRFFSPLSVDDFIKKLQFISYTRPALAKARGAVVTLAEAEGLRAHANAVRARFSAKDES